MVRYAFVKRLPGRDLKILNKPFLLPPQTRSSHKRTLVLDLDETLVHCQMKKFDNYGTGIFF